MCVPFFSPRLDTYKVHVTQTRPPFPSHFVMDIYLYIKEKEVERRDGGIPLTDQILFYVDDEKKEEEEKTSVGRLFKNGPNGMRRKRKRKTVAVNSVKLDVKPGLESETKRFSSCVYVCGSTWQDRRATIPPHHVGSA